MIVSCPSCSTRNHLSAREAGGLAKAQCRTCSYQWVEIETLQAIDITEHRNRNLPTLLNHEGAPDQEVHRLGELARQAQSHFAEKQALRARKFKQWGGFALFLLSPLVAASLTPETVVAAAPVSIKAYEALGYDINLYGLDIRHVERQHAIVGGVRILSVKGEITNIDTTTRKLPWLRFALVGPSGEELYTWTLNTAAKPLRPGETTGFVTRVSAPPEASQNLKIRFARADEIAIAKASATP